VKPAHFDSLSFTIQPVIERKMGCKFIWGEVKKIDVEKKEATIKTIFDPSPENRDIIGFDYCMICAGCNFNMFHPWGESLWFPTVHEEARPEGSWSHIDERFYEGRRRHILEEFVYIKGLAAKKATILVIGAGFIGVEWATELQYFFPDLNITVIDMLPRSLGPLPDSAAEYCQEYLDDNGIKTFYGIAAGLGGGKAKRGKETISEEEFWNHIELPNGADKFYICTGVKASNYFMPPETKSKFGPGGGGWIFMNRHLQVVKRKTMEADEMCPEDFELWGDGSVFAIGDCNYGCIPRAQKYAPKDGKGAVDGKGEFTDKNYSPSDWDLPPIPKISYPGEEQAMHAIRNIEILDQQEHGKHPGCGCWPHRVPKELVKTWFPWGAGMFATSLGPHDACFVVAANENKGSGYMVNWWIPAALQKEIIETTKVDECRDRPIGKLIWHFVHHTPIHCWGRAPWFLP
jgi:hypothetical protein